MVYFFPKKPAPWAHLLIKFFIVWLSTFSSFSVLFLYNISHISNYCKGFLACIFRSTDLVWFEIVPQKSMLTLLGSRLSIFLQGKTFFKRFSTLSGFVLFQVRSWKMLVSFFFRRDPFFDMFYISMKYNSNNPSHLTLNATELQSLQSVCWICCWNYNFWQGICY